MAMGLEIVGGRGVSQWPPVDMVILAKGGGVVVVTKPSEMMAWLTDHGVSVHQKEHKEEGIWGER